jgi:hypothetical protein
MNHAISAVYHAGVFRPLEPVDWPEGTRAEVIPVGQATPSSPREAGQIATWPPGFFEQTAGVLADEEFER